MTATSTFPFSRTSVAPFFVGNDATVLSNGDVVIGHDVWIGSNVTIMSGVVVGSGSVLAANSHVVKDVLPYEIVGGNPAQHIRFRFDDELREVLLDLSWWDWPVHVIERNLDFLLSPPSVEGIQKIKTIRKTLEK